MMYGFGDDRQLLASTVHLPRSSWWTMSHRHCSKRSKRPSTANGRGVARRTRRWIAICSLCCARIAGGRTASSSLEVWKEVKATTEKKSTEIWNAIDLALLQAAN